MPSGENSLKIRDLDAWLQDLGFESQGAREEAARKIGRAAINAAINAELPNGYIEIRDCLSPGGWRLLDNTALAEVRWRQHEKHPHVINPDGTVPPEEIRAMQMRQPTYESMATLSGKGYVRIRLHRDDMRRFAVEILGRTFDGQPDQAKQKSAPDDLVNDPNLTKLQKQQPPRSEFPELIAPKNPGIWFKPTCAMAREFYEKNGRMPNDHKEAWDRLSNNPPKGFDIELTEIKNPNLKRKMEMGLKRSGETLRRKAFYESWKRWTGN